MDKLKSEFKALMAHLERTRSEPRPRLSVLLKTHIDKCIPSSTAALAPDLPALIADARTEVIEVLRDELAENNQEMQPLLDFMDNFTIASLPARRDGSPYRPQTQFDNIQQGLKDLRRMMQGQQDGSSFTTTRDILSKAKSIKGQIEGLIDKSHQAFDPPPSAVNAIKKVISVADQEIAFNQLLNSRSHDGQSFADFIDNLDKKCAPVATRRRRLEEIARQLRCVDIDNVHLTNVMFAAWTKAAAVAADPTIKDHLILEGFLRVFCRSSVHWEEDPRVWPWVLAHLESQAEGLQRHADESPSIEPLSVDVALRMYLAIFCSLYMWCSKQNSNAENGAMDLLYQILDHQNVDARDILNRFKIPNSMNDQKALWLASLHDLLSGFKKEASSPKILKSLWKAQVSTKSLHAFSAAEVHLRSYDATPWSIALASKLGFFFVEAIRRHSEPEMGDDTLIAKRMRTRLDKIAKHSLPAAPPSGSRLEVECKGYYESLALRGDTVRSKAHGQKLSSWLLGKSFHEAVLQAAKTKSEEVMADQTEVTDLLESVFCKPITMDNAPRSWQALRHMALDTRDPDFQRWLWSPISQKPVHEGAVADANHFFGPAELLQH